MTNKKTLHTLLTISLASSLLLLTSCTSDTTESPKQTKPEQTTVREDQSKETSAIENGTAFYEATKEYINLEPHDKEWLQIANAKNEETEAVNEIWFATATQDSAKKISKTILEADNFRSANDPAPATAEEQEKRLAEGAPEEDPLNFSGLLEAEDGKTMSVTVYIDETSPDKIVSYSFMLMQ